jgi:hypothetical protein
MMIGTMRRGRMVFTALNRVRVNVRVRAGVMVIVMIMMKMTTTMTLVIMMMTLCCRWAAGCATTGSNRANTRTITSTPPGGGRFRCNSTRCGATRVALSSGIFSSIRTGPGRWIRRC